MGAYLRRRALGQRVRMAAELRELNRIGVNLNQMARALNSEHGKRVEGIARTLVQKRR